MILYRVRALCTEIIHYHGQSFEHASMIFDSAKGSRTMEQKVVGEWRDVMTYRAWEE
jgi:hypothetical protein